MMYKIRPCQHYSKTIRIGISGNYLLLPICTSDRIPMFHSNHPVKSAGVDVLEDISVVDFARARFFASWIVSHLKITNLVPTPFNVLDEIAFSDLLMVDVE